MQGDRQESSLKNNPYVAIQDISTSNQGGNIPLVTRKASDQYTLLCN